MELKNENKENRKARRKPTVDLSTMVYGKVPPQAKDLEEAILGAIMLEKNAIDRVSDLLRPGTFYVDAHNYIYAGMLELREKNEPIDILTVTEQMKRRELLDSVGGPYALTKLTTNVVSTANLEPWARIIFQKWMMREIIRVGGEMIGSAYEDSTDVFELLEEVSENFFKVTAQIYSGQLKSFHSLMSKQIQLMEVPKLSGVTGVPTGYAGVDQMTAGWQPDDLIILAARPSVGKSALAGQFAYRTAKNTKMATLIFSLEMSAEKFTSRIIAAETKVPMAAIVHQNVGKRDQLRMWRLNEVAENIPYFIDDSANQTLGSISSQSRKAVKKFGVGFIVIDYLQLISLHSDQQKRSGNRDQELGILTRGLKQLAKELHIPIMALSQLSRETEKRDTKRPRLSDLRESGNIEQDADVVAFLHRPYYYTQRENPQELVDPMMKTSTDLIFAKHRNGALGTVELIWRDVFTAFYDPSDDQPEFSSDDNSGFRGPTQGNWKPVGNPNLFIEKGSRQNSGEFDEGFENQSPI